MGASGRFESYMEHLAAGLGHVDRNAGLKGYCTGLVLPGARKSVEPMAARVDPCHASARHQSLHHFVAKADWSDVEMLKRVSQYVMPKVDFATGGYWIIDNTGFPKKGRRRAKEQRADTSSADKFAWSNIWKPSATTNA